MVKEEKHFYVVGIDASAIGINAIREFFSQVPDNTNMTFIILQYFSLEFKKLTNELFSKDNKLKVVKAADNMEICKNTVYLNPNNKNIIIKDKKLKLTDKNEKDGVSLPIDHFFHSLVSEFSDRSIIAIPTSTDTDGLYGIKTIKEAGGTVMTLASFTAQLNRKPKDTPNVFDTYLSKMTNLLTDRHQGQINYYQLLAQIYAPAAIFISSSFEVLFSTRNSERFLSLTDGILSQNLFDMVSGSLAKIFRNAAHRLETEDTVLKYQNISIDSDTKNLLADVIIRKVALPSEEKTILLIEFSDKNITDSDQVLIECSESESFTHKQINGLKTEVASKNQEKQKVIKGLNVNYEELKAAAHYLSIANMIFIAIDREQRVSYINKKGCSLLGYNENEILGANWFDLCISKNERKSVKEVYAKIISEEMEPVEYFENYILTRDGSSRLVAWHNSMLRDATGKVIQTISAGEDISDRRIIEEKYKESEETLRLAMEATNDGLWDLNVRENSIYLSPGWAKILGYTYDEIEQNYQSWEGRIHPNDRETALSAFNDTIAGKIERFYAEHRLQKKDGSWIWVLGRGRVIARDENGDPLRVIGTMSDISSWKESQKKIEKSEYKYRTLFETMKQGVVYHDSKGNVLSANSAACEILGLSMEELTGKTSFDPRWHSIFMDGSPAPGDSHPVMVALRSGKAVTKTLGVFNPNDNDYRWIRTSATPLYKNNEDRPYQVNVTFEDITELKKMTEQLNTSLKEKEILLKEIHHRVKNNLQTIISLLNLHSAYNGKSDEREMLDDLKNRIYSMATVHAKLYRSTNLSNIRLDEYITSFIEQSYSSQKRQNEIELKLDLDEITLSINQAIPCGLLLNELLSNVFKHSVTNKKGALVHIVCKNENDTFCHLAVSDNGKGLPEDFNIENVTSLGLNLVRELALQLHGELHIVSDNMTTFSVTFKVIQK